MWHSRRHNGKQDDKNVETNHFELSSTTRDNAQPHAVSKGCKQGIHPATDPSNSIAKEWIHSAMAPDWTTLPKRKTFQRPLVEMRFLTVARASLLSAVLVSSWAAGFGAAPLPREPEPLPRPLAPLPKGGGAASVVLSSDFTAPPPLPLFGGKSLKEPVEDDVDGVDDDKDDDQDGDDDDDDDDDGDVDDDAVRSQGGRG